MAGRCPLIIDVCQTRTNVRTAQPFCSCERGTTTDSSARVSSVAPPAPIHPAASLSTRSWRCVGSSPTVSCKTTARRTHRLATHLAGELRGPMLGPDTHFVQRYLGNCPEVSGKFLAYIATAPTTSRQTEVTREGEVGCRGPGNPEHCSPAPRRPVLPMPSHGASFALLTAIRRGGRESSQCLRSKTRCRCRRPRP